MEEYIKQMAKKIATDLIAMENLKNDGRRPQDQTLYCQETDDIMEDLKQAVLSEMGYNNEE